ncbi:MAG TPA: hypothetical protein VMX97_03690, partial [Hyphomicrobiaceae bacterium]|nr:hypothetical protein [Hyphomicrobiaceae bacterium]
GMLELAHMKQGEFNTRLNNVLDPLRAHNPSIKDMRIIRLPDKANEALITGLRTGVVPKYLEPQARAIRAILDEVRAYSEEAGLNIGYEKNYFPRVWDTRKVVTERGAVETMLMEEGGYTPEVAQSIVAKILREDGSPEMATDRSARLTSKQDFSEWRRTAGVQGGPAKGSFEHGRKIDIPDEKLAPWLVNDIEAVLNSYINMAVERAEYARVAGQGEGKLNQIVAQIVDESGEAPHKVAQKIYDQFDAIQHQFHYLENDAVRHFVRGSNAAEVVLHLGLVSLAQMPEFLAPFAIHRVSGRTASGLKVPLKSLAVGLLHGAKDAASAASVLLTGKRRIDKTGLTKHLEQIGLIAPMALESSAAARFSGTAGKFTHRFVRMTLLEGITNVQRLVAADVIKSMIVENSIALDKGNIRPAKRRMYEQELVELGIAPDEAIAWNRAGRPKDGPFQDKMDLALVRGGFQTVIEANPANRPMRYNDPRWAQVLLFKSFMSVFGNTVIKRFGQKMVSKDWTTPRKLSALSAVLASIGVAYYVQYLREAITGYAPRDIDDPKRFSDAVDRSGWSGSATFLWGLFSPFRYGYSDSTSQRIFNLAGPLVGDTAKVADAVMSGDPEKLAETAAKLTPVLNTNQWSRAEVKEMYEEIFEELD